MGKSSKHCHYPQEPPDHSQQDLKPISKFFWEGKKCPNFDAKVGEICIITYKDNANWAKLVNCGILGIWLGYAENHPTGTYRIVNLQKKIF